MQCVYTVDYYSALKRKALLSHAIPMNLEEVMLSEISQAHKDRCCVIPLTGGTFVETERRMVAAGPGAWDGELVFNG